MFELVTEGECRSPDNRYAREVIVSAGTLVAHEATIATVVALMSRQRGVSA